MKKKIALLLASVMALSAVPMNLFAASKNSLVYQSTVVPEKTVFTQGLSGLSQWSSGSGVISHTAGNATITGTALSRKDVDYIVTAPELKIELEDELPVNSSIALQLTGAEWFFRNEDHQERFPWNGVVEQRRIEWGDPNYVYQDNGDLVGAVYDDDGALISGTYVGEYRPYVRYTDLSGQFILKTGRVPSVAGDYTWYSQQNTANYDVRKALWVPASSFSSTTAVGGVLYNGYRNGLGYPAPVSRTVTDNELGRTYSYEDGTYEWVSGDIRPDDNTAGSVINSVQMNGNVPYVLRVNESDPSRATLEFPEGGTRGNTLVVPIVSRTTTKSDVKLDIVATNLSSLSSQSFVFGRTDSRLTTTYVNDPITSRDEFPLDKLIIKENRIDSIHNGTFKLMLPSGFEWVDTFNGNNTGSGSVRLYTEYGLGGEGIIDSIGYAQYNSGGYSGGYYDLANQVWINGNNNSYRDLTTLEIKISGLDYSNQTPGTIYFTGLKIAAEEDSNYWGDVNVTIENIASTEIKTETFVAGKRVEWSYEFKLEGDVKTFVNGRYENYDSANPRDDYHYLGSKIMFKEATANTWHAERATEFTLPEWVKVRKLELTDTEKFLIDNENNINENNTLKTSRSSALVLEAYTLNNNGQYTMAGTENFGTVFYPNDSKQYGHVTVDGNVIRLRNLHIDKDERAQVKMKLWISVESGYEGDITLTAGGPAVREDVAPIVIGKSVNPVKVETKVSDIKIGLQFQTVADVRVTETAAGYLLSGKTLKLSISDQISEDMVFTPGFSVSVESGDLKIKSLRTTANSDAYGNTISNNGNGTITVDIASRSTQASTILYTNLQVKVTRGVPQSNLNNDKDFIGYDVVAWGSAIAENYGNKGYDRNKAADMFATAGIGANYLKVVTAATGRDTMLTTVVKVTIGDPVIQVGPTTYTMDTAAYISADSSTMIPLSAVARALGIPDDGVIWSDAERSVVIINAAGGTSVKFIIGDSNMYINGNAVPMLNTIGGPVKAEIKDDRSFVPFRALGTAFGILVDWVEETQTAVFNAENEA